MEFKSIFLTDDGSPIRNVGVSPGSLYSFSEKGNTYIINGLDNNGYNYGPVSIYSKLRDGFGDTSTKSIMQMYFELYKAIASVTPETFSVISKTDAFSANKKVKATGSYISDVLSVNDDFGFWKSISWTQVCVDTRVVISVKSGHTREEVLTKEWERSFEQECTYYNNQNSTLVTRDLDYFNLRGKFFMFKVYMETEFNDKNPIVRDLIVSYGGKHSVFFFSNKIRVDGSSFGNMILTASATLPTKTEIAFGVGPGGSVNWKDYKIVDVDKLESVPSSFGNNMRVGIRFTSYDEIQVPVVHEFALSFDSDSDNKINEA